MLDTADITDALTSLAGRQRAYRRYRAYYDGDHPLHFSTDQWHQAFGSLFRQLSYNRARPVVDAYANRLAVTGWETPGTNDGADDPLGDAAMAIWERNRLPKRQGELWAEALRAGDAYLIVWPGDDGNARLDINRGHLIEPLYDDERPERLIGAVKCWQVTSGPLKGHWRVNAYDADTITRLVSRSPRDERPKKANALLPLEDDGGPEIPNDYGVVPVFPFANNGETGGLGSSELVDVIPLQDGVNKSVADMLIAGEYVAFPQRWVVGAAPVTNPFTNEEEEQFKAAVDRVWAVDNEQARFGQFDPANMAQYTQAQDAWDLKISRVSMVPVHWLSMSGTPPSGEALKTAESPFVAKCKDRQLAFGQALAEALTFALRIEGAAIADDIYVQPIWAAAETRSDLDLLQQAALKQALGVPQARIWEELGYTEEEIAEFTAEKEAAAQRQQEMFAQSFDRGQEAPAFGGRP